MLVFYAGGFLILSGLLAWKLSRNNAFDWIDLPVFNDIGKPTHERGIVTSQPGLYFCGLFFLHALWSETLTGMPIDARYIAEHVAATRTLSGAAVTSI